MGNLVAVQLGPAVEFDALVFCSGPTLQHLIDATGLVASCKDLVCTED